MLVALLGFCGGAASASDPIEGVWSFGGGAVAVQRTGDGSFQGTVVAATTFVVCPHPVGQLMWTGIRAQPDGSYWGRHQWFHGAACELDPNPGLTAWRILTTASGARVLAVCFSDPGDPSQPKIAPDGKVTDSTYGCVESDPLAPLPGSSPANELDFDKLVRLPRTTPRSSCRRSLTLRPRNLDYDPLKEIVVMFDGKKVADITGTKRLSKKIVFNHLPEGTFKIRVVAITVLKQRFTRTRVYRGCSAKVKAPGPRRLGHG